ncbi:MAG: RAMP superfamily CRISPR-associated protein [Chloroflexi bacterium]|nr:RAMP superfamily CRISPR-associated protein [Chloroflexota bacterium]
MVCRVFGSTGLAAKVVIPDFKLAPDELSADGQWYGAYQVRHGVSIDRDTETAADSRLYTTEAVPAGTRFHCEVIVENGSDADKGLVLLGLRAFEKKLVTLGGGSSRGLGQVQLTITDCQEIPAGGSGLIDFLVSGDRLPVDEAARLGKITALRADLRENWGCKMHKRRFNEFTLSFTIRPQGPLLIKSGQESGADPTLLDMNFVRTHHSGLGNSTVYLPGSSLKGTLRSYAEKVARTLGEEKGTHFPPFSCNPLGTSASPGRTDYYCGKYLDKKGEQADKHRLACPICRTFGHTSLASHLRLSDAYPLDPLEPERMTWFEEANETEERDGVAIDRVSGAVAVGPFNLEVVTKGAFQGTLTLSNFQLWQLGLLAIVLRDLGQGRVPIGFAKSRGLGRVAVDYNRAEVAYPGRFRAEAAGHDL